MGQNTDFLYPPNIIYRICEIFCIVDIIVCFVRSPKSCKKPQRLRVVIKTYGSTYFMIDMISIFPIFIMNRLLVVFQFPKIFKIFRGIDSTYRIIKIVRI